MSDPEAGVGPGVERDVVTAGEAAAMHNLLDAPGAPPADGDRLPALWHWMAFLPRTPQRELGGDGHPKPAGELSSVAIGPRMFAGATITVSAGARVGQRLERRAQVTRIEDKEGRSGSLRFVTVRYEIGAAGEAVIVDVQNIVYRPTPPPVSASSSPASAQPQASPTTEATPEAWPWEIAFTPEPTMLFRFSALTYNAHRIHYDVPYATEVEGYPGLVVHGPLQAISLAEVCRRFAPERPITSFTFRAVSPAFAGSPLRFVGRPSPGGDVVELRTLDARGVTTMTATATLGS
jgi:3-methylfumaryl-CoA hydratase